mmetsp:Transcript_35540/g.94665  ORF Transcript_35540/g.94665 Transcript_35540/m.94665 type:complete len:229 (-) Transcript_35540:102-788(-)
MLCRGRSRCGGRASASRWLRQRRQRLLQVPTGLVKMSCGSAFALPAAGTASVSRKPVMCWMQLMWTWMSMQHRRSCGWCRAPLLRLAAATARAFPTLSSERLRQTLKSRISSRSSRSSPGSRTSRSGPTSCSSHSSRSRLSRRSSRIRDVGFGLESGIWRNHRSCSSSRIITISSSSSNSSTSSTRRPDASRWTWSPRLMRSGIHTQKMSALHKAGPCHTEVHPPAVP